MFTETEADLIQLFLISLVLSSTSNKWSMLEMLFKGVLISWEVEAIIISDNFSIDFACSELTISVISFNIINLASSRPKIMLLYLNSNIHLVLYSSSLLFSDFSHKMYLLSVYLLFLISWSKFTPRSAFCYFKS